MKAVELSKDDKAQLVARIQHFFDRELDQPVGIIKAELVMEFFAREIGAAYYKKGLQDAYAAFAKRAEDVADDIYGLERAATD
ncbi:DUF2164 domain-containing protein [Rhizobium sp. P32RR-XVIII]|uniref:DUF2164 domain-containing protein n=1 Tax=Rhizobium sp. P32RR-XVIII TaxID=2726738 RepID=UPI001456C565|nr:DUF2164 domain-containing protein [Rhizobium sp. P32RR-XVIII]NLS04716.1 DUF2164 domain-containing protein [Rhizobium sp. P32RR-XVIII]